jgi:hypothetical protein
MQAVVVLVLLVAAVVPQAQVAQAVVVLVLARLFLQLMERLILAAVAVVAQM